jgi:hypothetical protein
MFSKKWKRGKLIMFKLVAEKGREGQKLSRNRLQLTNRMFQPRYKFKTINLFCENVQALQMKSGFSLGK